MLTLSSYSLSGGASGLSIVAAVEGFCYEGRRFSWRLLNRAPVIGIEFALSYDVFRVFPFLFAVGMRYP